MAPEPVTPTVEEIAGILTRMNIKPKMGFEIWELALIKARKWIDARKKRREIIDTVLEMHGEEGM